jgi:hypothetical protein
MSIPFGIEKLKKSGYTVRRIPHAELPLSRTVSDWMDDHFFEVSINGHKIWNNQDQYGWFLTHELNVFAAKVPDVRQSTFAESVDA